MAVDAFVPLWLHAKFEFFENSYRYSHDAVVVSFIFRNRRKNLFGDARQASR